MTLSKTNNLITDNFLLENKYAIELYHGYAKKMPIIDYHNHLSPKDLAENKIFNSISELWIDGDHYKWRAMRTLGISEDYITGDASDKEKFLKWAYCVPYTMRNPLFHWTHLELARYFSINDSLSEQSGERILKEISSQVNDPKFSAQNLILKMDVESLCTTEDPTDNLKHHQSLAQGSFKTKVSTAFRPDNVLNIDTDTYLEYLQELGEASNLNIESYKNLLEALKMRLAYFHSNGCRLSDHGLPHMYAEDFTETEVENIFKNKIEGKNITNAEALKFKSAVLRFLAEQYYELGWVQQFHLGPIRDTNSRMNNLMGPNTGWDSIGDYPQAKNLAKFLDLLDRENKLTKTIIYNLNPSDNAVMATMIGNFNDGSIKGKVQWGSGWWFLDQKDGMEEQMNVLSNMGLISCFIGMLTDSRSLLSFPRHEYFRRILCNLFGRDIQNGLLPNDMDFIGKMIQDICYNNAKQYFDF